MALPIADVSRFLIESAPVSERAICRALGRSEAWAYNAKARAKDPRLSTVTRLASVSGLELAIVDPATGSVVQAIEPPPAPEPDGD